MLIEIKLPRTAKSTLGNSQPSAFSARQHIYADKELRKGGIVRRDLANQKAEDVEQNDLIDLVMSKY